MSKGMEVERTEGSIKVPVGPKVLGRMFNVLGDPIDGGEPVPAGKIRLRATLTGSDRTVEQTETVAQADTPLAAAVCCLPGALRFFPDGKSRMRIEIALSAAGGWEISIAPKDNPEDVVWHKTGRTDGKFPEVL